MSRIENKLDWCLKKAEKEGTKHRGLKKIKPDKDQAALHLLKAQRDFKVMEYLTDGNFDEWAIIASFYSRYQCLLAILAQVGYETRNQECTFAVIEQLIEDKKISITKEEFYKIYSSKARETEDADDMVFKRESSQYGTGFSSIKVEIEMLKKDTKSFVEKTRVVLLELMEQ